QQTQAASPGHLTAGVGGFQITAAATLHRDGGQLGGGRRRLCQRVDGRNQYTSRRQMAQQGRKKQRMVSHALILLKMFRKTRRKNPLPHLTAQAFMKKSQKTR